MARVQDLNPEEIQEYLDGGCGIVCIQKLTNSRHHSYVQRIIERNNLETYIAFDEFTYKYDPESLINFEWTWEEDVLDEIARRLYNNGEFNLSENDLEMDGLSKYTNDKYGGILRYLTIKKAWFLSDGLRVNCRECLATKSIYDFYRKRNPKISFFGVSYECKSCTKKRGHKWNRENPERVREIATINARKYYRLYPERYRLYTTQSVAKRRALDLHLGHDFTVTENEKLFGTTCVLTGDTDIAYDHFVPLNWGHVGSYNRNMYPLNQRLNSSKWAHNPFDWFEDNCERFGLDRRKFDDLVTKLAELNGLTTDEYKDFVYWCEANKRTAEEIATDPRQSIDIWRESLRK